MDGMRVLKKWNKVVFLCGTILSPLAKTASTLVLAYFVGQIFSLVCYSAN